MLRRLGLILTVWLLFTDSARAVETLRGELHVHSDMSTGDFSLDRLAELAEKQGVDVLLLSENYLVRIEYGLPPFRALTRVVHDERSIVDYGIDRYLARVAATRRRFPRLVIVPGVEVIPHYSWTGSPFDHDMTLHDTQKNLLVFGISDPARLRSLPVIGNRVSYFTLNPTIDLIPALLLIPGVRLLLLKQRQRRTIRGVAVRVRRRRWVAGGLCCLVGAIVIVRAWPFSGDRYPYWQDAGLAPHQQLIDHVRNLGGVTVWSFPEARDSGERFVSSVHVAWRTEPYADDLLHTSNYTAFGALYEDTTTFEQPGRGWDILLGKYARGERTQPVWGVAESGFHAFEAGKQIGSVQTMFLAAERSEAGVLDAFKRGRMYALIRPASVPLTLAEFVVAAGSRSAELGETLRVEAGTPIEVRIAFDLGSALPQPGRVNLVRNGKVVEMWATDVPVRLVHRETFDGAPAFYRVDVSAPARLLTNPIFVTLR